jgi:glycosyltransferase involved in cell wall biosynthesis
MLAELPLPPAHKTGWPWTEESSPLPATQPNGAPWPQISIVTTNYNYGEFLEATIRSVLLQGYPNLQYILTDGGSDDQSVNIIRQYDRWLSWESVTGISQSAGINRGLARATGEILAFLNSDDYYEPKALWMIARAMSDTQQRYVVMGHTYQVDANGKRVRLWETRLPQSHSLVFQYRLCVIRGLVVMPTQPSVFWPRHISDQIGLLREDLQFAMDYEYWLRILTQGYHFYLGTQK